MPQIGDIKTARELERKGTNKYIWCSCIDCGRERWVLLTRGEPHNLRCRPCGCKVHPAIFWGSENPNWKGGRRARWDSYERVRIYKDDFFYPMADKDGYVAVHRLVVAKHLNRCLLPWEIVHHKNGVKNDNRLENLALLPTARYHLPDSILKSQVKRLLKDIELCQKRITLLEAENAQIRAKLEEINEENTKPSDSFQMA